MTFRSSSKRRLVVVLFLAFAVVLASIWYYGRSRPVTSYKGQPLTYSTSKPSETKPTSTNFTWKGDASDPKYIQLPSINSNGYVEKVGTDQHHAVGVPDNVYMAAWFTLSQPPGTRGLSIIDGHVTGLHGPGIFRYLNKLKPGDTFNVTLGSGKVLNYVVADNTSVPLDQVSSVLFSQDPKVKSQLNLITCSGQFDYQTHSYNQREIVTAKLTSPLQT